MITPSDIADRLAELVAEQFPGEKIYRELVESDFDRPSTLIVQESCEVDMGYGSNVVKMRPTFTLTTYVEVDHYHHSHLEALHLRQLKLVGLLIPGYIKVKGRAPKVIGVKLGGGYDFDTVTVTFSYTLDRNDFMDIPQLPMMGQLHLTEEVVTYG